MPVTMCSQRVAKCLGLENQVVGVYRSHDSAWLHVFCQDCTQANGRSRAARQRLADDMVSREFWQLAARQIDILRVRDDQYPLRRHKWRQTVKGLLQHRSLTGEVEELLGICLTAARPQAGSAATGQDDNDKAIGNFHCWGV